MEVTFVKTSKAAFEEGFLRAIEQDGNSVSDTIYMDAVAARSLPLIFIALVPPSFGVLIVCLSSRGRAVSGRLPRMPCRRRGSRIKS
jgi:hypothetical protein